MRLVLFRSLWTNGYDLESALREVASGEFDGVEGPVPSDESARREFAGKLANSGAPFVAEIVTGGGYVPTERSPGSHLDEFRRLLDAALPLKPRFVTVLTGCDAWSVTLSVEFLGHAMAVAHERGIVASFETHRSRPTFSPWATIEILRQLPALRLTCDFSHWCCVCERLVLDEEPALLTAVAQHAHHVHARVGYAQGPQVPHPAAPEFAIELAAHERWWDAITTVRRSSAHAELTMTPEFGPDGYLQAAPFTRVPAANLGEINRWMAVRQRSRFAAPDRVAAPAFT